MKRMAWTIILVTLAAGTASANFLDEFSSPALDPGWRIAYEDTNFWSLTERPGFLRIQSQFLAVNPVNFFMHFESVTGDFSAATRLTCHPDSAGQAAALWADYDSLASTPWAIVGIGNYLGVATVVLAMLADSFSGAVYPDTLVYLRIRTSSDTVFAEYSPDDQNWSVIRSAYNSLFHEVQRAGLMAINHADLGATPQTPAMDADYDWFHLTALQGVEEQDGQDAPSVSVFPNPFRTSTRICIGQRATSKELKIYDASGSFVASFTLGSMPSALSWLGTDQSGRPVPAGVYFVRGEGSASVIARIVKVK